VVSNSVAEPLSDVAAIKTALLRQLSSPVRWVESVQRMAADGVSIALEIGPREVVSGLVRRIDGSLALHSVTDAAGVEKLDMEALA
jgi:[acyl-carrier-protein] S-malonyltransferase